MGYHLKFVRNNTYIKINFSISKYTTYNDCTSNTDMTKTQFYNLYSKEVDTTFPGIRNWGTHMRDTHHNVHGAWYIGDHREGGRNPPPLALRSHLSDLPQPKISK